MAGSLHHNLEDPIAKSSFGGFLPEVLYVYGGCVLKTGDAHIANDLLHRLSVGKVLVTMYLPGGKVKEITGLNVDLF
jgi:hypothetical protein